MKVTAIAHQNDDLTVVNAARVSFDDKMIDVASWDQDRETRLIRDLAQDGDWRPFGHARYRFSMGFTGDAIDLALWASTAPGSVIETAWSHADACIEIEDSLWGWLTNPPPGLPFDVLDEIRQAAPISYDAIRTLVGIPWAEGNEVSGSGFRMEGPMREAPQSVTLLIEMPIFVARELMRSNVGIVYSEVSNPYVDEEPTFWRASLSDRSDGHCKHWAEHSIAQAVQSWKTTKRLAPELARTFLPVSMMTKVWMTSTLDAMLRVITLGEKYAQKEIRDLAALMKEAL